MSDKAPPIGLMPHWRWLEMRREEIDAAIQRYQEAGRPIPEAWTDERRALAASGTPSTVTDDGG